MTTSEAVKILREQTIPALRASGGSGHADAREAALDEIGRSQHGNVTVPCGCDCGCGVYVPGCWATLLCPDCATEECPTPAQESEGQMSRPETARAIFIERLRLMLDGLE